MDVQINRRTLTEDDLARMRIPKRHWGAKYDQIVEWTSSDGIPSAKSIAKGYLENIEEMGRRGVGLVLWGVNGVGKTSIAVVIAKEFRRRGRTVFFMEAANLKRMVIEREMFDDDQTCWDRALSVDVLVLDDLGKGTQDEKGFGARMLDELIRHRNASLLVTLITANMQPVQLKDELKHSTISSLKEHATPVHVYGDDRREQIPFESLAGLEAAHGQK